MASPELATIIETLAATATTPDERLALARAYLVADDLQSAAAVAAELPDNAEALYLLGQVRGLLGDLAGAMTAWQQTLAVQPRHRKAMLGLASLQTDQGDVEAAMATYAHGLNHHPADPYLIYRLHALDPGHPWLMAARGDSRSLDRDPQAAHEYNQHAAAQAPDDPWVLWRLVWAARQSGHSTWALEAWRQLVARRPDFIHDLYTVGRRIWTDAGRD